MRYKLGFKDKIHTRRNFESILKEGKKFSSANLVAFISFHRDKIDERDRSRLGIIISRKNLKLPTHVARNRLKRRLREIFRLKRWEFIKTADIILMPRKAAGEVGYKHLECEFLEIIRKAGLV